MCYTHLLDLYFLYLNSFLSFYVYYILNNILYCPLYVTIYLIIRIFFHIVFLHFDLYHLPTLYHSLLFLLFNLLFLLSSLQLQTYPKYPKNPENLRISNFHLLRRLNTKSSFFPPKFPKPQASVNTTFSKTPFFLKTPLGFPSTPAFSYQTPLRCGKLGKFYFYDDLWAIF